jgi:hypothetical protein
MDELKALEMIIENKLDNYFSQNEALNEIKRIFPDLAFLPPTRGWAGSPDFLLKLVELVVISSPKYVVEFGSGVSSIILGAAMKKFAQGKVDSFDHEEVFSNNTNRFLEVNGLKNVVNVNYSRLMPYCYNENNWVWYEKQQIDKIESEIDLLVVDGPPRFIQERSRFLAIPILFDRLSSKSTIVLDDANRIDEKKVIEDWIDFLNSKNVKYLISTFEYFDKGLMIIEIQK